MDIGICVDTPGHIDEPELRPGFDLERRATFCRAYPGVPAQIGNARKDLAAVLADCPATDLVMLCLSELATNAVLHSRSGAPGGHFSVAASISADEQVTVSVTDDGGPWIRRVNDPGDIRHGHGLDIVAKLSAAMGITGDHGGRAVWFTCGWTAS